MKRYKLELILEGFGSKEMVADIVKTTYWIPFTYVDNTRIDMFGRYIVELYVPFRFVGLMILRKYGFNKK